jgi:dTDP-4-amino-4,6-dideoxygalactose transaminase
LSEQLPDIGLPFSGHPGHSACHIIPVILPNTIDREPVMEFLKEKQIQTSIHYPPVHTFSSFRDTYSANGAGDLINTEQVAVKELTLPLYPGLDQEKIDYVVFSLREAFEALII